MIGLYCCIIIHVLIIMYFTVTVNTATYEDYMYGLWTADQDFCDDAGIESMMIFIGPPIKSWTSTTRAGYIVICDDISNQPIEITYRTGWAPPRVSKYVVSAKIKFDTEDIFECGDQPVTFTFDMSAGRLTIEGEKLYGVFYKQNALSNSFAVNQDD